MLTIKFDGVDELRRQLSGFSDRRFSAAIATALTRSAKHAQGELKQEMVRSLDRPTPYTLNALRIWPATATELSARVAFRNEGESGNANNYLMPNVAGGARVTNRVEAALRAIGALPSGWFATPGQGATLDAYGNMARSQTMQILAQLRSSKMAGPQPKGASLQAARKAGGRFFVMPVGGKTQPGVYQQEMFGKSITPVLVFVQQPQYSKRYPFFDLAKRIAEDRLPIEVERSIAEHVNRLAAKR